MFEMIFCKCIYQIALNLVNNTLIMLLNLEFHKYDKRFLLSTQILVLLHSRANLIMRKLSSSSLLFSLGLHDYLSK